MPTSMTQQYMMQQVQAILQILTCSRRQQKPATTSHSKRSKRTNEDVAFKGGEIWDVSTDAGQPSGSSDSDADSEHRSTPSAGFAPPPGLAVEQALRSQRHAEQAHPWSRTANLVERHVVNKEQKQSQWNPQAAPFVPEASQNLLALKQALDQLAPNEVATVKSILDSKMCSNTMGNPSVQHSRWDSLGTPTARRPFTPFQGGRTQQQSRRKEIDTPMESGDTLRTYLRDLSLVDNGRVLTLRKISKLGLNSGELLKTYFSQFGKVDRIMVSHTLSKSGTTSGTNKTRVRPAALGFALMGSVEDAKAALKHGSHVVGGVEISVLDFQSHSIEGTD